MSLTLADEWLDGFAGGGGASTGLMQAGYRIRVAINHWPVSVATHQANHPDTLHECLDMSQSDPRRFPRTPAAWFSPSCTHHTSAQGVRRERGQLSLVDDVPETLDELREAEPDASRATMFDVLRFAEVHRYRHVVVENVTEIQDWTLYPYWLGMMTALGYRHRVQVLDAARVGPNPVPQHRERYFGMFWREDQAEPPMVTMHNRLVGAEAILDPDPGLLISERARPLASATMDRITATLDRYSDRQVLVSYYGASKVGRPVSRPMGTLTTKARHALVTRGARGLHYRMLNNAEMARAMGFPGDYRWTGTSSDITKQLGNAVCVNVSEAIGRSLLEASA